MLSSVYHEKADCDGKPSDVFKCYFCLQLKCRRCSCTKDETGKVCDACFWKIMPQTEENKGRMIDEFLEGDEGKGSIPDGKWNGHTFNDTFIVQTALAMRTNRRRGIPVDALKDGNVGDVMRARCSEGGYDFDACWEEARSRSRK